MNQTADLTDLKARRLAAIRAMLARQARVADFLDRLADRPPQALLLEGGREEEREGLALYWAALLNCDRRRAAGAELLPPTGQGRSACLDCAACRQVLDMVHLDLLWLDGREDFIKIDPVRELRVKVGQPPRGEGWRVVVFMEAQRLTPEAANALLKSMEEPRPGNSFLLLAPQRETLLPTLVSRSFILTLAWPRRDAPVIRLPRLPEPAEESTKKKKDAEPPRLDEDQARQEWSAELIRFLQTGQGWFTRTSLKGAVDRRLARLVLLELQRALVEVLAGRPESDLAAYLAQAGGPGYWRRLGRIADQGLEALDAQVNPAMVLDWAATQGYFRT